MALVYLTGDCCLAFESFPELLLLLEHFVGQLVSALEDVAWYQEGAGRGLISLFVCFKKHYLLSHECVFVIEASNCAEFLFRGHGMC